MLSANANLKAAEVLAIFGASRWNGNTRKLLDAVLAPIPQAGLVDLSAHNVGHYDYKNANEGDDFLPIAEAMIEVRMIIIASPVYWYTMSAQMKIFFDRLTDLTDIHKPLGKALADKTMFAVSTGGSPTPPASFIDPIKNTAGYFNMRWGGLHYASLTSGDLDEAQKKEAEDFGRKVADFNLEQIA